MKLSYGLLWMPPSWVADENTEGEQHGEQHVTNETESVEDGGEQEPLLGLRGLPDVVTSGVRRAVRLGVSRLLTAVGEVVSRVGGHTQTTAQATQHHLEGKTSRDIHFHNNYITVTRLYIFIFNPSCQQKLIVVILPPTGSEERAVLWVGSIPVAILLSCQDMKNIALQLHRHEYSWVVKKETLQRQYSGLNIPLGHQYELYEPF